MKKITTLIALFFLAGSHSAFSQAITMHDVIALSKSEVSKSAEYLKEKKWKCIGTVKVEPQDIQDPFGKYAHFTNCFFMLPEYKNKFRADPGNKAEGVFRDIYSKLRDSVFIYYYSISKRQYPVGLLYKTNRNKLNKITGYLKHNKYSQRFTRDSLVVYEIKKSVENNVTIDKSNSPSIEYYIDRCWKYADMNRKIKR